MIFGLAQKQNEDLSGRVDDMFEQLGVKPAVGSCRLGNFGKDTRTRPVKVDFSSTSTASNIFARAQ